MYTKVIQQCLAHALDAIKCGDKLCAILSHYIVIIYEQYNIYHYHLHNLEEHLVLHVVSSDKIPNTWLKTTMQIMNCNIDIVYRLHWYMKK